MTTPPRLPTFRPPVKTVSWISTISIALNIVLIIGFIILWRPPTPVSPLPTMETQSSTPTAQTPNTSENQDPTLKFLSNKENFNFDEPIKFSFELSNLSSKDINFELLKANGEPFTTEEARLELNETEISLPAGQFVGKFKLRAMYKGKELASLEFVVELPQIDLDQVLKVQPNININGKYILLPEDSSIGLSDTSKGWRLKTSVDSQEATIEDNKIMLSKDYKREKDNFPVGIEMSGVLDENGNTYVYQGLLPLINQMTMPQDTNLSQPLYKYDIFGDKFPDDKTDTQVLDNISAFKDGGVFSLTEFKSGDKNYIKVMIIGKLNSTTFNSIPEFKDVKLDNMTIYLFPNPTLMKPNDQALRTLPGNGVANIRSTAVGVNFFFVKTLENGSLEIVLFGVVEKK